MAIELRIYPDGNNEYYDLVEAEDSARKKNLKNPNSCAVCEIINGGARVGQSKFIVVERVDAQAD